MLCVTKPKMRKDRILRKKKRAHNRTKAAQGACKQNLDNRRTGKWQRKTAQGRKKYGRRSALTTQNVKTKQIGSPNRTRERKQKS